MFANIYDMFACILWYKEETVIIATYDVFVNDIRLTGLWYFKPPSYLSLRFYCTVLLEIRYTLIESK